MEPFLPRDGADGRLDGLDIMKNPEAGRGEPQHQWSTSEPL